MAGAFSMWCWRPWKDCTASGNRKKIIFIHRPVKSEDVLIYFKFKESCISSFDDNQTVVGAAKNLKIVVSYNSKKIGSLLSEVLPYLFKNKFFHNSSKVSCSKKTIYKPLNVMVSRKTKSNSPKTKSDSSSFVTIMDPISGKSGKSDLSSTIKDDVSLLKEYKISSTSPQCDVISIPDSSTTATEVSSEFVPVKHQISQKVYESIGSEYETAEICPNEHFEVNPKVINMNKLADIKISISKIDNSLCTHSFNDEPFNVEQDIDRIQILSRRCTGSNVKYSQLSKNSRLRVSAPMKLSTFSQYNDDQITNDCLYSEQSKEDAAIDNDSIIEESCTSNFQTATDESEQPLTNSTKISKSADALWKPEIYRESMTNETNAQNFETAEDQASNKTVKVSTPKDVLLQQAFSRNSQMVVDDNQIEESCTPNFQTAADESEQPLHNSPEISKSADALWKPEIYRENMTNETNTQNFETAEDQASNKTVKVSIPKDVLAHQAASRNSQVVVDNNQNLDKPNEKLKNISSEASEILTESLKSRATLNKNWHMKSDTCNLTEEKLHLQEPTKIDTENALFDGNLGINREFAVNDKKFLKANEDSVLTEKKNSVISIKISKPMNSSWSETESRQLENRILNKESDEAITKFGISDTINTINEHPLAKMVVKSTEVISEFEKPPGKCSTAVNSYATKKRRWRQKSKFVKPSEAVEDNKTAKKKVLKTVVHNKSVSKECSGFLDKVDNRNGIIQQYQSVGEDVHTEDDKLIKSISTNLNENQISNNLNLIGDLIHETDFNKPCMVLTRSDDKDNISSEDEIPLERLAEKWKKEKFKIAHYSQLKRSNSGDKSISEDQKSHHELEHAKLHLTDNREETSIDLKKETIMQCSNENGKTKSQIVSLDDGNIMPEECETLKYFGGNLKNRHEPLDHETKKQSSNNLDLSKSIDNLPKIIVDKVCDANNKGNDIEEIKCTEELVEVDQNKNKTQISDENCNNKTRDFNQTVSTTFEAKKKRKLYNPEDLTYLEDSVLDDFSTKLVQVKLPIQSDIQNSGLNRCKQFDENNDTVVPLNDSDVTIKRSVKTRRIVKAPKQLDGKKCVHSNFKEFEKNNNTIVALNDCDTKRSCSRCKSLKTPRKLKVVNPNISLNLLNNKQKCYSQLRPVFYNMLESFRKEVGTSFIEILEEPIFKKEKIIKKKRTRNKTRTKFSTKNNLTKPIDMHVRTQKPNVSSSSSSGASLKLEKKMCTIRNSDTTLPSIADSYCPLPESHIERNNHQRKINIISDIQIRPKRKSFEDNTEPPPKKNKTGKFTNTLPQNTTKLEKTAEQQFESEKIDGETQLPVISESITHKEISSWIITGSPKYSQFSEKRYVLKHSYPMFKSLLTPLDSSQEYKDVLKIFQILKKYH